MDHGPAAPQIASRTTPSAVDPATRFRVPAAWPLIPVLILQAVLSLRLIRADTAFQDEALYLMGSPFCIK